MGQLNSDWKVLSCSLPLFSHDLDGMSEILHKHQEEKAVTVYIF